MLACELVGTRLARLFGLTTFEYAIIDVGDELKGMLPAEERPQVGKAYITKGEEGFEWSGDPKQLSTLSNPDDITRLVLFDTFTRNWDRCKPDTVPDRHRNVFFVQNRRDIPRGKGLIVAMDQGHCFSQGFELDPSVLLGDTATRDERVYGLFPSFEPLLAYAVAEDVRRRMQDITPATVASILADIPEQWGGIPSIRGGLNGFILQRKDFLYHNMHRILGKRVRWQGAWMPHAREG